MSIAFRVGLLGEGKLTKAELGIVLKATGVKLVVELVDGEPVELLLAEDGSIDEWPPEEASVPLYRKLFASIGTIRSDVAAAAELCVLVPGEVAKPYRIARQVPGVDGWHVKSLDIAIAEVEGHCEENGISCVDVLTVMRRAEELRVGIIFGERAS